jgi:hypothetical protein
MATQYETQITFRVYEIVRTGSVGAFETAYGLVYVQSFDNRDEAAQWIKEDGKRNVDYTIIEVFRKK